MIAANFHQQLLLHIAVVVAVVMTWSLALHPWPTYDTSTTTTTRRQQGQKQIVKLFVNFAARCLFAMTECVCMYYVLSWFQGNMQFKYPIKCAYEYESTERGIEKVKYLNIYFFFLYSNSLKHFLSSPKSIYNSLGYAWYFLSLSVVFGISFVFCILYVCIGNFSQANPFGKLYMHHKKAQRRKTQQRIFSN